MDTIHLLKVLKTFLIHFKTVMLIHLCRLRDSSPLVRRNALTVLTHLILNDMVKVRGQISSMAICLEDSNPRIADLAKLFFHELAQKVHTLSTFFLTNFCVFFAGQYIVQCTS